MRREAALPHLKGAVKIAAYILNGLPKLGKR